MAQINRYYDQELVKKRIHAGGHRKIIGGMWDDIGYLQFNYIRDRGLTSDMKFLDVGCGCLRGGLHFVQYLESGHYFGIDQSQALLDVGYDTELKQAKLQHNLPRNNLSCTDAFDTSVFDTTFDMALAVSVFTHLTLNHLKLCLTKLSDVIKPGGKFYASVFYSPKNHDWSRPLTHTPGLVTSYPDRDPYHYQKSDLAACCIDLPWTLERVERWDHPRNQWMATFSLSNDVTEKCNQI